MRISPVRKKTFSIMNHRGFSGVRVHKNGIVVSLPKSALKANGTIKPEVMAMLNELTRENILTLEQKYNAICEVDIA